MPRPHMDTRRSVVISEMFPKCGTEERYRKVTQKKDVCAIAQYSARRSILADLFHESVTGTHGDAVAAARFSDR
jgi:hypothetical protein